MSIDIDLRPSLRQYQVPAWTAWERDKIKRLLLVWHRRAGKDELALRAGAVAAATKPANYWHCLPLYEQARKAIWEAVNPHTGRRRIDEAFPVEIRKSTDKQSMSIELWNGSIWRVVGSDNPDSLVGAPPLGIVFSEWALANPSAWAYLAPILDENGGWAMFITTPRGRNHVKSMLDMAKRSPDWFAEVLTPNETGYPIERIEKQRVEYHAIFGEDEGDALIEQEYWCSFEAAVLGAYWGKEVVKAEREGRICQVDYDPDVPVQTAWDLGVGDSTAIWFFQVLPGRVNVIDYYEANGFGADHYVKHLDGKPYRYSIDWVPHDAKVREWTQTNEEGLAKTRVEVLIGMGRRPEVVPLASLADSINAGRQLLPRCYFDEKRCAKGLETLREYRREWDDGKKVFKTTPLHNWASHGASAFRYLAMAHKSVSPPPKVLAPPRPSMAASVEDMLRRQSAVSGNTRRL